MGAMTAGAALLEVGVAGMALADPAEGRESGDLHVFATYPGGALVAVIDGLGHGREAALAARTAAAVLEAAPATSIVLLIERCHEALRRLRGAVMTVARFHADGSSLSWCGVGNVDAVLYRADPLAERRSESIVVRGGVVGHRIPPLRAAEQRVARGDTLILVTDGIRSSFRDGLALERSPQEIAQGVLDRHGRGTDDALVLVARYLGGPG
jgi:negative regulator of sigma-B (phosphoserine phosphatase)